MLGVPISFFYDEGDPIHAPPVSDSVINEADDPLRRQETIELVTAFAEIKDATIAKRLIELVRRLAETRAR